jgi:SNF2 family DNA or RNA helicase
MIDLIQAEFDKLGYAYFTLTGATPSAERQRMSKAFNQGEKDFFLISLKAGGTGLNLTGADTVILVDLWWNPAVEEQAVGRAHRMGQKNPVDVYRLVTDGTIEDKILELQDSKRNLVNTVLEGSQTSSSLTVEEIKEILGL